MVQAKTAKKRQRLWDELLRILADANRARSNAAPKPVRGSSSPGNQFRENGHQFYCK
jgi:hypothetical protein